MSPRCLATSGICVELMIADANLRSADSTELVAQHRETTRHAVAYELDGSRGLQLNQRALRLLEPLRRRREVLVRVLLRCPS